MTNREKLNECIKVNGSCLMCYGYFCHTEIYYIAMCEEIGKDCFRADYEIYSKSWVETKINKVLY